MNTNAIITNLKARLESDFDKLVKQRICDEEPWTHSRDRANLELGHDSVTATLLPLLEQAIQGLEKISMYHSHEGSLAREFLASIRERAEGVTMIKDGSER